MNSGLTPLLALPGCFYFKFPLITWVKAKKDVEIMRKREQFKDRTVEKTIKNYN